MTRKLEFIGVIVGNCVGAYIFVALTWRPPALRAGGDLSPRIAFYVPARREKMRLAEK